MDDNAEAPAAAGASAPAEPKVSEMLKAARAAHGLTLEQVATELRIELQQLEALEDDRFERIGVPVFVKGYLRQYGQRLGLDYRDLLAQYYKQTSLQEVRIRPSKTIKLHDERQITIWVIAVLALLVVIAALAVWWLNGGGFDFGRSPAPQANPESTAPAAAAPPEPAASAPAATATENPEPQPAAAAGAASPPPVVAQGAGPASSSVPLALTFEQQSWAEVNDARGTRLYYGLGTAGHREEVRGEPPFSVVLGNAGGVKIVIDGEDFKIPTKGRPDEYARFSVDIATD